jgi:putative hydrolase of the HAD superfamily
MRDLTARQHLLIDADDTLWENNIYFEDAFDEFVDFLGHASMSAAEIRVVLDAIETANIKIHGYGAANFARNLAQCYERLAEREIRGDDLATAMSFAERILDCPMQLIEGVAQTLEYLAARHELTLFTKGHPEEQKLKIDRSGLGAYFSHTAIVREKDADAYAALARERELDARRTWMVGNSPKSDINPALEAGLNAVYIPHPRTWSLEHEEIQQADGRLLVLENFAGLRRHF